MYVHNYIKIASHEGATSSCLSNIWAGFLVYSNICAVLDKMQGIYMYMYMHIHVPVYKVHWNSAYLVFASLYNPYTCTCV